jgi:catechol 2,3-dioxygenase-like lactoylglutathione lyase family enzyme
MLGNYPVYATIGVKDFEGAKAFYEAVLGLSPKNMGYEIPGGQLYSSGDSALFVYESQFGGTNQATSATWAVDDIQAVISELKGKGVTFEHYDFPDTTMEGDVHVGMGMKSAWFKDPDGNILNINQS